jgi:hypothetical protein
MTDAEISFDLANAYNDYFYWFNRMSNLVKLLNQHSVYDNSKDYRELMYWYFECKMNLQQSTSNIETIIKEGE